MTDLDEGEMNRRKSAQKDRLRRAEEEQLRELDRRGQQDQQNFEKIMTAFAAATGQSGGR